MSFTGDLEHLPIVDVIQLIHAAKKSGTLTVTGRKGQSQLIFRDGYIGCANHLHNTVRIGKILVEMKAITPEVLQQALGEQKAAGANRKPLIATLMGKGLIDKDTAFKGLQLLIEMTIVEILTWKSGTFSLEVDEVKISDEFRYFPEKLNEEFLVNSQNVLMDALRIYDEKKRDGELIEEEDQPDVGPIVEDTGWSVSVDDLGLSDLDKLETRIPGVFSVLEEKDPMAVHRERINRLAPQLSAPDRDRILAYLGDAADAAKEGQTPQGASRAIIVFSSDDFLNYLLASLGKSYGFMIFSTNDEQDLDLILDQSILKGIKPLVVMDCPQKAREGFSAEKLNRLRREKKSRYPLVETLQLSASQEVEFALQSYREGARAVFPRPFAEEPAGESAASILAFLEAFRLYLQNYFEQQGEVAEDTLARGVSDLIGLSTVPEVAQAVLLAVAGLFPRALTLVAGQQDLVAEKGVGFTPGVREPSAVASLRIPLSGSTLLHKVVDEGRPFFGLLYDGAVSGPLFAAIGAPASPKVLMLPLLRRGKTLAVTYADFGDAEVEPVIMEKIQRLASQASLVLENAFYRKKLENPPQ